MLWTFIKCKDKVDTTPLEEQKKKIPASLSGKGAVLQIGKSLIRLTLGSLLFCLCLL